MNLLCSQLVLNSCPSCFSLIFYSLHLHAISQPPWGEETNTEYLYQQVWVNWCGVEPRLGLGDFPMQPGWSCFYILSEEERGLLRQESHQSESRRWGSWTEALERKDALLEDPLARSRQLGRGPVKTIDS